MAASYYVSLKSGSVVLIANVTETPTLVLNDGVASTVSSGTYRNLISAFGQSTNDYTDNAPIWGPGFSMQPHYTMHAADGLKLRTNAIDPAGPFTTYKDDRLMAVAPRALTWAESHWKFVTADGNYFIPYKEVLAMSNSEPLY